VANFIFGLQKTQGATLKTGGANHNIIPFLKPPLIALLMKEPEMLLTDAFCEHTMQQHVTVAGQKAPVGGRVYSLGAYNASQILAGLRGSLRGVHGRRQGGIAGEGRRGTGRNMGKERRF